MTKWFEQYTAYVPVRTTITASTWGCWQAVSLRCLGCKHHFWRAVSLRCLGCKQHFLYGTASMCACASRTLTCTEHGYECTSYCPKEGGDD